MGEFSDTRARANLADRIVAIGWFQSSIWPCHVFPDILLISNLRRLVLPLSLSPSVGYPTLVVTRGFLPCPPSSPNPRPNHIPTKGLFVPPSPDHSFPNHHRLLYIKWSTFHHRASVLVRAFLTIRQELKVTAVGFFPLDGAAAHSPINRHGSREPATVHQVL